MEFTIHLTYNLAEDDNDHDAIAERFGAAGMTDVLLGTGRPGRLGIMVQHAGDSAIQALETVSAPLKLLLPTATMTTVFVTQV